MASGHEGSVFFIMALLSLFNPAGGFRYHLRALRYPGSLWQPFRLALGEFLMSWQTSSKTLLIVGPSGGYCLPLLLFERFDRLICLEPDPVARLIFRRRLTHAPLRRHPQIEFIAKDYLLENPERLVRLAESSGDAAILFSNVLGQLRCLLQIDSESDPRLALIRQAVAQATKHRAFASFHDRVSGGICPTFAQPWLSDCRLSDAALLSCLFADGKEQDRMKRPELLDSLTEGFFPATLPHAYFTWEIKPGMFHLIEAVTSLCRHSAPD